MEWESIVVKVVMSAVIVGVAIAASIALRKALEKAGDSGEGKGSLSIFKNILRVMIWIWAACGVADVGFGVDLAALIGALGIMGIAISLGAQQTIANIIGGVIVSLSKSMNVGEWFVVAGHKEGKLIDTSWRCTVFEDEDGIRFEVPNSEVVSSVVDKGLNYAFIVIPFALKPSTPDIAGLLLECEQVLYDAQVASGTDCEGMIPKASISESTLGAIQAEVKVYANRSFDARSVKREILPALFDLLQAKDALAEIPVEQSS